MLVVISIIAVMVTIVVGVSQIVIARASVERTKVNMQVILQAIEAFRETSGAYPPADGSATPAERSAVLFAALSGNPAARAKLASLPSDAIKKIDGNDCFVDGFDQPLDYSPDGGVGGTPVLISAGADDDFTTEKDNIRSDGQ